MEYSKSAQKIKDTYDFICDFLSKNNYPPSVRDICKHMSFKSTASAQYYLEKLENQGLIKKSSGKNRAIYIVENKTESIDCTTKKVPFLGNVAAGQPLFAGVNVDEYFNIPTDVFPCKNDTFILKIKGESMIDIGIFDCDYVVVEKQDYAENGDLAVVLIDNNEVTLKRFFQENGYVRLHPENSTMRDIIIYPEHSIKILGIAKGLMRNTM